MCTQFPPRQQQAIVHAHEQKLGTKALLLQGLRMCPNHKASDSCFLFADLYTVLLPVYYLHRMDGGYPSLISSPTWLHLPASSPLNTPRVEVRDCLGKRNHSSKMPQKQMSQCLSTVQSSTPLSAATFQQEGASIL